MIFPANWLFCRDFMLDCETEEFGQDANDRQPVSAARKDP